MAMPRNRSQPESLPNWQLLSGAQFHIVALRLVTMAPRRFGGDSL